MEESFIETYLFKFFNSLIFAKVELARSLPPFNVVCTNPPLVSAAMSPIKVFTLQ